MKSYAEATYKDAFHSSHAYMTINQIEDNKTIKEQFFISKLSDYDIHCDWHTPNTFYNKYNKTNENLKYLNSLFIDIDEQAFYDNYMDNEIYDPSKPIWFYRSAQDILDHMTFHAMPMPSVINKTPHGFHIYWIFEESYIATKKTKALYSHIQKAFCKLLNADPYACTPERYMRIPKNMVYENYEQLVSLQELQFYVNDYYNFEYGNMNKLSWLEDYFDGQKGTEGYKQLAKEEQYKKLKEKNKNSADKQTHSSAILCPNSRIIQKGITILIDNIAVGNRNTSYYILASYYKNIQDISENEALENITEINDNIAKPMKYNQIRSTVASVYRSKHIFCYNWLKDMTGIIYPAFYKFKKKREDRTNSHYNEWMKDLFKFFIATKKSVIEGTQETIARKLKMPLRSLKVILKMINSSVFGKLFRVETTKGRNGRTKIYFVNDKKNQHTPIYHSQKNNNLFPINRKNYKIKKCKLPNKFRVLCRVLE